LPPGWSARKISASFREDSARLSWIVGLFIFTCNDDPAAGADRGNVEPKLSMFVPFAAPLFAQAEAPNLFSMLWPMLMIGVLFYFLMLRPEKRKRMEVAQMQDSLKKNDRVVTIGGIIGVVVNAQSGSDQITIRVDENNNTRINVLRTSISRVLGDEKTTDSKTADPTPA
jgi:preprotein translocase subunit YajC